MSLKREIGIINLVKFFQIFIFTFIISFELFSAEDLGPRRILFKIDKVDVIGMKKVEKEAVLEKISAIAGLELDNYTLKKDLERIYGLKYFESVEAHKKNVKGQNVLLFIVEEKPIISKITFEGTDEVQKDDLTAELGAKEFSILDVNTIKEDLKKLSKIYEEKGYFLAQVDYELKKVDKENVELIYRIHENEKVRVKKITFLGNKAFTEGQLKGIMETREEGLFSFMTESGNFKEFNFQTDIEKLKYFYRTKGHLQVNIGTPQVTVSEDKRWVFISIKVNEGPQFSINSISYQGEVLFTDKELGDKTLLKSGDIYSEETLRKDIQVLTEMYQDKGYAFANVLRDLKHIPGEHKVDVDFSFEKGKIAYFGKIIVKGNTKSRDKVVRRELMIREGEMFSGSNLRRSKENVNRLGFFEKGSVIFNTISSKERDDVLDVEITVKETNTGQISMGAGYSTATKGFLQASIAETNFLGRGQNLSFSLSLADTSQTFNIGFTEPYFLDSKWTAGGDVFLTKNSTSDSYEYKRKGFNLRVGYPLFDYTRLFMTYKFEDTLISVVNDPTIDVDIENGIASSIRTSLVRDKRNNRFEPSRGYYLSLSSEYAGIGGEKKWIKNEFDGRYFKDVWGDLVFRSRLHASKLHMNGRAIPRTEKFTLGGARNLRGYDFEGIGPKRTAERTFSDGSKRDVTYNLGGMFAAYTTLEFEHPLAREAGLKWVVFFDAGDAGDYNKYKINMDYGFGFRWFSPIGVLRFEFGFPIDPEPGEPDKQFHFDIGQLF